MPDDVTRLEEAVKAARELIGDAGINRVDDPLALWKGEFGDEYADRCLPSENEINARCAQWQSIVARTAFPPASWHKPQADITVVEIGANQGQNLTALHRLYPGLRLIGIEPNAKARSRIPSYVETLEGTAQSVPLEDDSADLVFTSGVLIHIPPQDLLKACSEVVRVSKRYVVAIEYFNPTPVEVLYRGHGGALWKQDYGAIYIDHFGLKPIAAGFSWKRLTGLDDVHWWLLEKPTERVYDIHTDQHMTVTRRV